MSVAAPDRASAATAHFDADAILAAQEVPTLTVGNFLYRGRLLSIEQWLPFWERLQRMDAAPVADSSDAAVEAMKARLAFYRDYLTAVFPTSDYRFWAPDPVKHLLRQPFAVVEQTVTFFFILQARATFGSLADLATSPEPATTGTASPPSTPAPPNAPAPAPNGDG